MAGKHVKHIRHATAQADLYTGEDGEITVDTTKKELRVHDAVTPGGTPTARADMQNMETASNSKNGIMLASHVQAIEAANAAIAQNIVDIAANLSLIQTNIAAISSLSGTIAATNSTLAGIVAAYLNKNNNLNDVANKATARVNLGLEIGVNVQAYSAILAQFIALNHADGNFIVGNGTSFQVENGSTARASLGLGNVAETSSYTSGRITMTGPGQLMSWTHGKGKLPLALVFFAKCFSTDNQYAANEVIMFSNMDNSESDASNGPVANGNLIYTSAENSNVINLRVDNRGWYLPYRDGQNGAQIMAPNKWQVWFRAIFD